VRVRRLAIVVLQLRAGDRGCVSSNGGAGAGLQLALAEAA
jgi:hypothetical protein